MRDHKQINIRTLPLLFITLKWQRPILTSLAETKTKYFMQLCVETALKDAINDYVHVTLASKSPARYPKSIYSKNNFHLFF
jgi:hypothetical protein